MPLVVTRLGRFCARSFKAPGDDTQSAAARRGRGTAPAQLLLRRIEVVFPHWLPAERVVDGARAVYSRASLDTSLRCFRRLPAARGADQRYEQAPEAAVCC